MKRGTVTMPENECQLEWLTPNPPRHKEALPSLEMNISY